MNKTNRALFLTALLLSTVITSYAVERVKRLYKVSYISRTVLGVSCPGNNGDPTVITKSGDILLISCGTEKGE